jgi:hypothetical protein
MSVFGDRAFREVIKVEEIIRPKQIGLLSL